MNTGSDRAGLGASSISRFAVICALLCVVFGVGGCVPQKRLCQVTIRTEPPGGRIYSGTDLMGTAPIVRYFEVPGMAKTEFRTGPWHAFWDDARTAPGTFTMRVPAGPPEKLEVNYQGKPTKVYPYLYVIQKPVVTPAPAAKVSTPPAPKPAPKPPQQPTITNSNTPRDSSANKAAVATVVVSAEPADCEVAVNGLLVGTAPARLSLPEGLHVIEVTKEGHKPVRKELRVIAGSDAVLRIKLQPN